MAAFYSAALLVIAQLICASRGSPEHVICLSCPPVAHPRDCVSFIEIWSHERCSTKIVLLANDSTVYQFGYEPANNCHNGDGQSSSQPRQRRISSTNIILCHECCEGNLCNWKRCGLAESSEPGLACLFGENVAGLSSDTSITYCNADERCYTGPAHSDRPHPLNARNYGCTTQVVCDRLSTSLPGNGFPRLCQRCCAQDACNAYICHSQVCNFHSDCWDLRTRCGYTSNGIYDIYPPPSHAHIRVRCDMTTDRGGWTVIQRRVDGSVNFTRTLEEYAEGFGDVSGEYWLGLDRIHILTTQGPVQMRVDLCKSTDQAGYAVYAGFSVSSRSDTYRLSSGTYRVGSLPDRLGEHNGKVFLAVGGCATTLRGGWWYFSSRKCYYIRLNDGRYSGGSNQGIVWPNFGGYGNWPNIRSSEMKIRSTQATGNASQPFECPP